MTVYEFIKNSFGIKEHPPRIIRQSIENSSDIDTIPWHVRPQPEIPPNDTPSVSKTTVFLAILLGLTLVGVIVLIQYNIVDFRTKLHNRSLQILMMIDSKNAEKYASLINSSEFESPSLSNDQTTGKYGLIENPNTITLQQVNNVGYSFYLSQIDYKGASPITDEIKNAITTTIYNAKFPKRLLNGVAIIVVNTLALKPHVNNPTSNDLDLIQMPDKTMTVVPEFTPDFLTGGGIYSQTSGSISLIYINSKMLGSLTDILTHELGHHIGSQLTDAEWTKFYQLRNIPSNTPRRGQEWVISPEEDFAEVYKNTFTGLRIKTVYGIIVKIHNWDFEYQCKKIHDDLAQNYEKTNTEFIIDKSGKITSIDYIDYQAKVENAITPNSQLQNCRKDVMLHLQKYPNDNIYGGLYTSIADQPMKDFIISLVNRLQ